MSEDFGSGVSRTLSALARQFTTVVWQQGKPPLDSEFNLMSQVTWENLSQWVRSQAHSGFFTDPVRPFDDFTFNKQWVNFFELGKAATSSTFPAVNELDPIIYANVNGWIIPVTGTRIDAVTNKVALNPPPTADERIDFVFLEVWRTLVAPNPSTLNKPTATTIWKYGNVEYAGTNEPDDLEDPAIGFETTERVQLQYRIRVFGVGEGLGATTDLYTYPDGLNDPNILGQGAAAAPVAGYTYTNMRDALGDPSLWRAGAGDAASRTDLGTVDGHTYAIPICAVFRRNTNPFTAVVTVGNPNENGGAERTPSARFLPDPRDGAVVLTDATLNGVLLPSATGLVTIADLVGSGLDDPLLFPPATQYVVIGTGIDEEIVGITAVNPAGPTITISTRGDGDTMAKRHPAGAPVRFYNSRPDGLYSDEIATPDLLDLRRSVTLGEWDHQELLFNALGSLVNNDLRTAFKKAGTGADNAGPVTTEVSYLWANTGGGPVPNHIAQVDGPDAIRTVWSDAAAIQGDVTVIIDNAAPLDANNNTATTWDVNLVTTWTVGASFVPTGFLNNSVPVTGFKNGSSFFLHIGGNSGDEGARGGFWQVPNPRAVRFVSPQEFWKKEGETSQQNPFRIRFLTERALRPAVEGQLASEHPGPMYPLRSQNFEKPFIVLGGLLNPTLTTTVNETTDLLRNPAGTFEIDVGFDFDAAGGFFPTGDLESLSVTGVGTPLLRGQRTLFDMLTQGGTDRTGASSEVYIVTWLNTLGPSGFGESNHGAFQVVGAGTAAVTKGSTNYTSTDASTATSIVVRPLNQDFDGNAFGLQGGVLNLEFRSQYMNAEDGLGKDAGLAAAVLVLTDIEGVSGGASNPWNPVNLSAAGAITQPVAAKFVIDTTLQWPPSHAAFARIPDDLLRFATRNGGTAYLRNQLSDVDSTFVTNTGNPTNERFYDFSQIQTWNRLPSLGADAPDAPNYGGNIVGSSEQDRDAELFLDKGSKTVIFRPFVGRNMLLQTQQTAANPSLIGTLNYTVAPIVAKDGAAIFTPLMTLGFPVPPEYMPRFGRQDIPYHIRVSDTDPFMPGINHLFTDQTDDTESVFNVIGGEDNTTGGNQVTPILFTTFGGLGAVYTERATLGAPAQPCYIGRKFSSTKIVSSDLGVGMSGIELPPYLGIARLYGVYEYQDYIAKIGAASPLQGAHLVDRITPIADPPTNLLRTGATKQTLFIRQDGAQDRTGETGDHTYIVPDSAIDISLIPTFADGNTFDTFDYVVECVVFGFSKNWINGNNVVLCRVHNGAGVARNDATDFEITSVKMTLPSAAVSNDELYGAINRTVYQGDPYMTRGGTTITVTDYTNRYGQVINDNAYFLNFTMQQFNAAGNMVVERPNPRSFEVLAAADFYTTVGTGKIGGQMYPGTPLDVGFTETGALDRIPALPGDPEWRVLQRAFTEGQKTNTQRAGLVIHLLETDKINGTDDTLSVRVDKIDGSTATFVGHTVRDPLSPDRFIGISAEALAHDLTDLINDGAKATGTVTVAVVPGAGDIVRIEDPNSFLNTTNFIARLAPALPNEFQIGADVNATALDFANTVNDFFADPQNQASLVTFTATALLNVVTIVASRGGVEGNVALTTTAPGNFTLSGATLTGGTDSAVKDNLKAVWANDRVCLQAIPEGAEGKLIKITLSRSATGWVPLAGTPLPVTESAQLEDKKGNLLYPIASDISAVTSAFLIGAENIPINAGTGNSPINIVGLTERLPLGILASDSDFLFEDPLADSGSFMKVSPGDLKTVFQDLPLTTEGNEFTRFLGSPGELLSMSDGSILAYEPENPDALPIPLTGATSFRLYRGGGASFLLSGRNPGGPLNWLVDSFASSLKPVLKGAVLACKALLIRNFTEVAFAVPSTRSTGDELQLVVLTQTVYGNGESVKEGVPLKGEVSPTGYGEGFAAVDRYRIPARPMDRGRSRTTPDPAQDPAPIFKPNS